MKLGIFAFTRMIAATAFILSIFGGTFGQDRVTPPPGYPFPPIPYALSPPYLSFLAEAERGVYSSLQKYKDQLENRLQLVQKYIDTYEKNVVNAVAHVENVPIEELISSHPLLVFRMLNRYTSEVEVLLSDLGTGAEGVFMNMMGSLKSVGRYPSTFEVGDVITSLLRVQNIYGFSSNGIADGQFVGNVTPVSQAKVSALTAEESFQIGEYALAYQFYTLAYDWLNLSRDKRQMEQSLSFNDSTVDILLDTLIEHHNKNCYALYHQGHEYLFADQVNRSNISQTPTLKNEILHSFMGSVPNITDPSIYLQQLYANHIGICNGRSFQSAKEQAKLSCWLGTFDSGYFAIGPLKVEMITQAPQVLQIHDFLPERWAEELKRMASGFVQRAPPSTEGEQATPRTAAYSWFHDPDLPPNMQLTRKIESVVGLNARGFEASEALQIATYAFGGHVHLHTDSKGPDDPRGDRIVTFLIYLNDVEVGGVTSFPSLGFGVRPTKGSALLWYTNKRSGIVDQRMVHAACPLIYGHKWIATKWIHSKQNMLTYPCGMSMEE